ncbi:hypothetical protein RRF57_012668 [Xylaria bambusicola]|uniref:Capsule polysaccharide biosynthesis protein n=1 Tax=Xylaria bambusicola TaxID=326684 RepID=A0AAN7V0T9_9PEZI
MPIPTPATLLRPTISALSPSEPTSNCRPFVRTITTKLFIYLSFPRRLLLRGGLELQEHSPSVHCSYLYHEYQRDSKALSDEQILADLQKFKPVKDGSEKNVWAYWDKGLAKCPPWCQRNIISWVRRLGPAWTVRVLDLVEGSPNHVSKYVGPAFFPSAFLEGTMTGPHLGPRPTAASIFVRRRLARRGFLLFRRLDNLCWNALADPSSPFEMAGFAIDMGPDVGMVFNGFIAARKGCRCIKYWHETFVEAWKGADSTAEMSNHPLLCHLPRYEPPPRNGKMPPFRYAQFADYLAQRVRHLKDPSVGWAGPEFFAKNVLLYDCSSEVYWAQRLTNWDGRKQFDLLRRQREGADKNSPHI